MGGEGIDKQVLMVNDYFFGLDDIVDFIRFNYTKDEMFAYYNYSLEKIEKKEVCINIKNWKKLRK